MYTTHNMYGAVDIAEDLRREYTRNIAGFRSFEDKMTQCTLAEFNLIRCYLLEQGYDPRFSIRVLEAHGDSKNGQYRYGDLVDEKIVGFSVEEWMKRFDGRADTLFVNCCNPGNVELAQPRESLLMYPTRNIPGNEVFQIMIEKKKSDILRVVEPQTHSRRLQGFASPR